MLMNICRIHKKTKGNENCTPPPNGIYKINTWVGAVIKKGSVVAVKKKECYTMHPLAFLNTMGSEFSYNWWESTYSSAQNLSLIFFFFLVIEDGLIRFVSSALLIICWLTHFVFYFVKLKAAIIKNRPYIFLFQIYIQRYGEIWLLWH